MLDMVTIGDFISFLLGMLVMLVVIAILTYPVFKSEFQCTEVALQKHGPGVYHEKCIQYSKKVGD